MQETKQRTQTKRLRRLGTRFFLALVLVGLLPFGVIGLYLINLESQSLTTQANQELKRLSGDVAEELETYVAELLQDSQIIATLPEVVSMDIERQQPLLERLFTHYDRYGQLASVDISGQILTTARPMELISINHIPSFVVAATEAKQSWVVAPHLFNPDVLVLHMHTPILDEGQELVGVLGSPVSLARLTAVLADTSIGGGQAFVIDEQGLVLLHPDPEQQAARRSYAGLIPLSGDNDTAVSGTTSYIMNDQEQIAGYAGVPGFGWTVVVERPNTEVLAPTAQARNLAIVGLAVTLLLAFLVAVFLSRRLTRQVTRIQAVFEQVLKGNYQARVEVVSDDEIGQIARDLNTMLDDTLALIQSREERDAIQTSVEKLLSEVSHVAGGDLTAEAAVTEDLTGEIANAINYMINQLREIIGNVQNTTGQVSTSAADIQLTVEALAKGSKAQAMQIGQASSAVDHMARSLQRVSSNATESAVVANRALVNAQQGVTVAQDTIQGMQVIRDRVQETARRIQYLGQSSGQIGEIVKVIGKIADRTSILALNASIQAAAAGEAGRGFAVVASEVEELASQSAQATQQISDLVKSVQAEIIQTTNAMDESSREVGFGSNLADQAGQVLAEIEQVSKELAALIQGITRSTHQHARETEGIALSMSQIAQETRESAAMTQQTMGSINGLTNLTDGLRRSVSTFRLPVTAGQPDPKPVLPQDKRSISTRRLSRPELMHE